FLLHEPIQQADERRVAEKLHTFGWWHHFPNSWLIADPTNNLTAEAIVNRLIPVFQQSQCIVFEVGEVHAWHGMITTDVEKRKLMSSWIAQFFSDSTNPVSPP